MQIDSSDRKKCILLFCRLEVEIASLKTAQIEKNQKMFSLFSHIDCLHLLYNYMPLFFFFNFFFAKEKGVFTSLPGTQAM